MTISRTTYNLSAPGGLFDVMAIILMNPLFGFPVIQNYCTCCQPADDQQNEVGNIPEP